MSLTRTQTEVVELARMHGRIWRNGSIVHAITNLGSEARCKIADPQWNDLFRRKILMFDDSPGGTRRYYRLATPPDAGQRISDHSMQCHQFESVIRNYREAIEEATVFERWGDSIPADTLAKAIERIEKESRKLAEFLKSR